MRVSGEMKGDPPPQTAPKEPVDAGESAVGIGSAENLDGTGTVPPILSMDADAAATCSSSASSLDPPIEEVGAKPSGQRVAGVKAILDGIAGPPTAKKSKEEIKEGVTQQAADAAEKALTQERMRAQSVHITVILETS